MKCSSPRLGSARRLTALSVSIALLVSGQLIAFSASAKTAFARAADSASSPIQVSGLTATLTAGGVLLRWRTNSTADNLGFNVYRVRNGERTRANREIIPGAMFAPGNPALMRAGYSYSWLDRSGSLDAMYFIEAVNVDGATAISESVTPTRSKTNSEFQQTTAALEASAASAADPFSKNYPAAEAQQPAAPSGTLQEQWAIAGQAALKIGIKKDGWYRVTQPQMVAAGFNPTVDIRNLRLFVDANEVAISTSQSSGTFGSADYIEFYGQGLDTPTTDTRLYYLIAGPTPGKRVIGEIISDDDPFPTPTPTPTPLPGSDSHTVTFRNPVFFSWVMQALSGWAQSQELNSGVSDSQHQPVRTVVPDSGNRGEPIESSSPSPSLTTEAGVLSVNPLPEVTAPKTIASSPARVPETSAAALLAKPTTQAALGPETPRTRKQRKSRKRKAKQTKRHAIERNHAVLADNFSPVSFGYTARIQERKVYLSNLLNGDQENFFGRVVSTTPITQTIVTSNPEPGASATLDFALQGVQNQFASPHQVNVAFNGVQIGSVLFGALEHPVRSITVPQVQTGNNTITFTKTSTGEVCIVDYVQLTYRHRFIADSDSLKFNLRGSQTVVVDGYTTPLVRLIDYTDPLNVQVSKPAAEVSASGYSITVPTTESHSKDQRLLYAIPLGQFDQPASLSLNQPSTLNLNTNAADFLIVSHKSLISSMAPLVALRQSQGMTAAVVDIEDVYDEFGYGLHGPQALKDFLQYATTNWTTKPRYVIFAGDATYDPRGYEGVGDFDLVPTKLIDATFSETASDDWLADFDHDGAADIPIGRLPFKTVADADKIIDKIVHFTPASFPEAALLIADDPGTPAVWDFETSSDAVQQLLPAAVTVQRVNVRVDGPALAKTNVINGFNAGRSVVNYSGHGNVDVWSGASIFNTADAAALTNGNKLSFVIVMDCLNGYYLSPTIVSLAEAFLKAPNGGAVAAFASSGLTITPGQRQMELELYRQLYGATPIALGDAIKIAKNASSDPDVRSTWIYFGDPSIKIR